MNDTKQHQKIMQVTKLDDVKMIVDFAPKEHHSKPYYIQQIQIGRTLQKSDVETDAL